MHDLRTNLDNIKLKINNLAKQSKFKQPVELIAVSKTFSSTKIREAYVCGQHSFAENYAMEFNKKVLELKDLNITWHYIGELQSNKIKYVAPFANWIHSVEKPSQIINISKYGISNPHIINTLIQIKIDKYKHGVNPDNIDYIIELGNMINQQHNMIFRGLMGIATDTNDIQIINNEFSQLNQLFMKLKTIFNNIDSLSMGMSNDFELAILNGATHLRIGSKIFGQRNYAK